MNLILVNGASMAGMQPVMRQVLKTAEAWMKKKGRNDVTITCGTNGEHSPGSLHYYGYALDFRTVYNDYLSTSEVDEYFKYFNEQLVHKGFFILMHSTHIHIGYNAALTNGTFA